MLVLQLSIPTMLRIGPLSILLLTLLNTWRCLTQGTPWLLTLSLLNVISNKSVLQKTLVRKANNTRPNERVVRQTDVRGDMVYELRNLVETSSSQTVVLMVDGVLLQTYQLTHLSLLREVTLKNFIVIHTSMSRFMASVTIFSMEVLGCSCGHQYSNFPTLTCPPKK
jgi:hypothetical protein